MQCVADAGTDDISLGSAFATTADVMMMMMIIIIIIN